MRILLLASMILGVCLGSAVAGLTVDPVAVAPADPVGQDLAAGEW